MVSLSFERVLTGFPHIRTVTSFKVRKPWDHFFALGFLKEDTESRVCGTFISPPILNFSLHQPAVVKYIAFVDIKDINSIFQREPSERGWPRTKIEKHFACIIVIEFFDVIFYPSLVDTELAVLQIWCLLQGIVGGRNHQEASDCANGQETVSVPPLGITTSVEVR